MVRMIDDDGPTASVEIKTKMAVSVIMSPAHVHEDAPDASDFNFGDNNGHDVYNDEDGIEHEEEENEFDTMSLTATKTFSSTVNT